MEMFGKNFYEKFCYISFLKSNCSSKTKLLNVLFNTSSGGKDFPGYVKEATGETDEKDAKFRTSLGTDICCHRQISNLVFDTSRWHLFVEIFLQGLTFFEMHS